MSQEIEVTPQIRERQARETAENLARLGLNPERVEPWEDGYRTAEEKDAFEWWYFDGHVDDGSALVLTFETKPMTKPSGPLTPSIMLMYRPEGGERRKSVVEFQPEEFSASTEGCDVRMGSSFVRGDLERFTLTNPVLNESFDMIEDLPGWARPLIHLFANPYYYNFVAEIELEVDLGGVKAHEKGSAIFEKMMFR